MVNLFDNFLKLLKPFFSGCGEQCHEITMIENWRGQRENDKRWTVYSQSGERWGERAETKATANRERYYSHNLRDKRSARF
jgi:hypothetical protein